MIGVKSRVPQFLSLCTIIVAVVIMRTTIDFYYKIFFGVLCTVLLFLIIGAEVYFQLLREKEERERITK